MRAFDWKNNAVLYRLRHEKWIKKPSATAAGGFLYHKTVLERRTVRVRALLLFMEMFGGQSLDIPILYM